MEKVVSSEVWIEFQDPTDIEGLYLRLPCLSLLMWSHIYHFNLSVYAGKREFQ